MASRLCARPDGADMPHHLIENAAFSGCLSSAASSSAMIGSSGNASPSVRQIRAWLPKSATVTGLLSFLARTSGAISPAHGLAQPCGLSHSTDRHLSFAFVQSHSFGSPVSSLRLR